VATSPSIRHPRPPPDQPKVPGGPRRLPLRPHLKNRPGDPRAYRPRQFFPFWSDGVRRRFRPFFGVSDLPDRLYDLPVSSSTRSPFYLARLHPVIAASLATRTSPPWSRLRVCARACLLLVILTPKHARVSRTSFRRPAGYCIATPLPLGRRRRSSPSWSPWRQASALG
jgi:hypothetical protein